MLEQIAADFGTHPMTLSKWLRVAEVEDGVQPGAKPGVTPTTGSAPAR